MATHRIDLRPDLRPNKWGKTPMSYQGEIIGASDQPEYSAARWLLNNGAALPSDMLETYRGDIFCVRGIVGELAKWTAVENDHGNPTSQLRPYGAFPAMTVGPQAVKTPSGVPFSPDPPGAA